MSAKNSREELELRITALLLGELSSDEAAALRQTIAQDAELARLHDRLKLAIELARETSASPQEEEMAKPEAVKLAPERRAKLLASFASPKTIKLVQQRRARRRELLALAAMAIGLLAVAGVLMPALHRSTSRAQRVTSLSGEPEFASLSASEDEVRAKVAPQGIQDGEAGQRPAQSLPYYAEEASVPRSAIISGSPPPAPPANQPAPPPSRPIRGYGLSGPVSDTPAPQNEGGAESEKLKSYAGRIALPEKEVALQVSDAMTRQPEVSDFFADSQSPAPKRFSWAAPSGGGGAAGSGGVPARSPAPATPGGSQTPGQNDRRNIQLFNDATPEALVKGTLADNVLAEQPAPRVDPATGLPVEAVDKTVQVDMLDAIVPPQVVEVNAVGYVNISGTAMNVTNGTHVAGGLSYYGVAPATNSFGGVNYSTFAAPTAIDGLAANLVGDLDVDGAALAHRSFRFKADDSGRAATKAGEYVGVRIAPQPSPITQAAQEARRAEIVLPSQPRGEVEKQVVAGSPIVVNEVMANPGPKSLEQLVDAKDRPTSDVVLGRDLDSLRQLRDRLASKIVQEKADAAIPKTGGVEIVDPAEAKAAKNPTILERIGGAFSSGVERSARIRAQKDPSDVSGIGTPDRSIEGFDPYWVQTEVERIQSKSVLSDVAQKLNLDEAWGEKRGREKLNAEETYRLLKEKTTVITDPKTGLIDIKVKSDKAEEAARIANTIAEVYRDQRLNEGRQLARGSLEMLEKAMVEQEQRIAQTAQELERRRKEVNSKSDAGISKPSAAAGIPQPEVFTAENPFSTFSLNVSDVSFKLAAASLEKGILPEPATVRTEEFINAFDYRDAEPTGSAPIAFAWDRARYPFAHDRDLVRFSVKTAASGRQPGRPLNLVLLLDNSGSMERADRLRIRQECLRVLASQLQTNDRVSVVAFARTAQLWVDGLPGAQGGELPQRVGSLAPEGGTNLEEAMNLAYRTAVRHYLAEGVNRVVLLTDGAANLGDVAPESLKKKVEENRRQGIALDCFGIGWDGYNDDLLEVLARNGDGRYGFVNTPEAATSDFAGQLAGALKVAASDVKLQVEFNPRRVTAYRQMGYAKHQLKKEQFRDNTVDAAEIGAAEAGNALYVVQVNPRGEGPLGTVRVRFKIPGTGDYREHEWPVPYDGAAKPLEQSAFPMRLATTAAAFSEWLVSSPYAAEVSPDRLLTYLSGVPESCPADPRPKKLEWMIRQAKSVAGK